MNVWSRMNHACVTNAKSSNHYLVHHQKYSNMNQNHAVTNVLKVVYCKGLRGNVSQECLLLMINRQCPN